MSKPLLCHNRLTIPVCFHAHNCLVSASLSFSILISPSSSGLVGRDGQSSTGCLPHASEIVKVQAACTDRKLVLGMWWQLAIVRGGCSLRDGKIAVADIEQAVSF